MNDNIQKRLIEALNDGDATLRADMQQLWEKMNNAYGDLTVTVSATELMFLLQLLGRAHGHRAELSGGPASVSNIMDNRSRSLLLDIAHPYRDRLAERVFKAYQAVKDTVPGCPC